MSQQVVNSKLSPYSLGDAIDWKPHIAFNVNAAAIIPYSLGDAINWKLFRFNALDKLLKIPYSLGDEIDWEQICCVKDLIINPSLLLVRGRDQLETQIQVYR